MSKKDSKYLDKLSISQGRSMCVRCKHTLGALDLLPVVSWLALRGRCRYCEKSISVQYPLVEITTAALFVASYIFWPNAFSHTQVAIFGLWLVLLTGLMALLVYDLRWKILPNRILYPLSAVAAAMAALQIATSNKPVEALINTLLAVLVGGGLFYVLFQISQGKWIGGGDVKLGWVLGLIVATPAKSFALIFIAALLGTLVSIPLLASKKLKRTSTIPFGPFLIVGAIIVMLYGHSILDWYQSNFLPYSI